MAMTRAQFARDLQDGINAHFGMSYDTWKPEYPQVFEKKTEGKRAFIDTVQRIGLGEAVEKAEGGVISFDAGAEGWVSRVTFQTYALAFAITEEAIDDNLYDDLSEVYGKELGKAMQHAKEVRCWDLLNRAFDPTAVGGDGKALCAPDHPLYNGGAYSNMLQTSADLSEEAIEDMMIQLGGWTTDRGRPIVVKAKQLIHSRFLDFTATRLLKTSGRVGTDLNDINAIKEGGFLPGGHMTGHYLTDPDTYFIQTDVDLGLCFWQRRGIKKGMEQDFKTGNLMYKTSERHGVSWTDPRCVIASQGSPV